MVQLSVVIATDDREFGMSVTGVLRASSVPVAIVKPTDDPAQAPNVVIVDIRQEQGGPETVERVRARWPDVVIVAVASSSDPERIIASMRAGANEFLAWPLGDVTPPEALQEGVQNALRKTADRLHTASRRGDDTARALAFFGTKGGVGTTTIAVNCATELARPGTQPTLIVDLNQFIGEVGLFLGMRPRFTVVDALDSVDRLDTVFLKKLVATHKSGLDIIAGSELVDRPSVTDAPALEQLFRILKQHYSNIILDGGTLTNPVAPMAAFAADASFLVANPDVASIRNTRRMVDRMRKLGVGFRPRARPPQPYVGQPGVRAGPHRGGRGATGRAGIPERLPHRVGSAQFRGSAHDEQQLGAGGGVRSVRQEPVGREARRSQEVGAGQAARTAPRPLQLVASPPSFSR